MQMAKNERISKCGGNFGVNKFLLKFFHTLFENKNYYCSRMCMQMFAPLLNIEKSLKQTVLIES